MVTLDKDLRDAGSVLHRLFALNLHQHFIAGLAESKTWQNLDVCTAGPDLPGTILWPLQHFRQGRAAASSSASVCSVGKGRRLAGNRPLAGLGECLIIAFHRQCVAPKLTV